MPCFSLIPPDLLTTALLVGDVILMAAFGFKQVLISSLLLSLSHLSIAPSHDSVYLINFTVRFHFLPFLSLLLVSLSIP
jgi:hypothetical protein